MKFSADIRVVRELLQRFKASRYWKDVAWLASGTVMAQAITLATMPVFSRIFTPRDFAVQNLFNQLIGVFSVFATLKYEFFVQLPKEDDDAFSLVKLVFGLGLLGVLAATPPLWIFRDAIAGLAGDAALSAWVAMIPVTAVAMSLGIALQGWTQRKKNFKRSGAAEVAGKAGYSIAILAGWFLLPGAGGLVMGWLGAALAKIAWLSKGARFFENRRPSPVAPVAKRYARLGGSQVLSNGFRVCTVAIPSLFIARNYGSEALGQYALAHFVVCFPSVLLATAIGNVFYQRASERWANGSGFGDLWRSTAMKLLLIGIPVYAVAILALPWALPLLFGGNWRPAGAYGAVLAISSFFAYLANPLEWSSLVVGAWWYISLWNAARTVTTVMLAGLALLFQWGIDAFINALVVQQVALYLVDFWAEWLFSHRALPPVANKAA